MGSVVAECGRSLLEAVTGTSELGEFLSAALAYAKARGGADDGAVFFFSGATETLELRSRTRKSGGPRPGLKPGEGAAGVAYQAGRPMLFSGEELKRVFVPWGGVGCQDLCAMVCLPVFGDQKTPQAIFCFDFKQSHDDDGALSARAERTMRLGEEFGSPSFARALWRVRSSQAQLDIRTAGEGPARQRQAVADFLGLVLSSFKNGGRAEPTFAYVQLVDHRRDTIRTVQGFGHPLSYQMSLSHSLKGNDVQARVVRDLQPTLIVGKHGSLDPVIYDHFGHKHLVRLWLPLFPLPLSWVASCPGHSLDEAMKDILIWNEPEVSKPATGPDAWLRVTGSWNQKVIPGIPPEALVYGTLELGYNREQENRPELAPFTLDLATWAAARAYEASDDLFRVTLEGSLDTIGKAVAEIAWPHRTTLSVAMPDWRTPQDRSYPTEPQWRAAVPQRADAVSPPPERPAFVRLAPPPLEEEPTVNSLRTRLAEQAAASARIALHLDDHAADLYTLIEESDSADHMATSYPDPRLDELLQEICREAAAEQCSYFLYDEVRPREPEPDKADPPPEHWRLVGVRQTWPLPAADGERPCRDEVLARKTAEEKVPKYEVGSDGAPSLVGLPLALSASSQAVIVLHFAPGSTLDDHRRRELEGRVVRWLYRLSLRHFLVVGRFSRMMQRLRVSLGEASRAAADAKAAQCLASFAPAVLSSVTSTMGAQAAFLTICSKPETGAPQIECLWACPYSESPAIRVGSGTFVVTPAECAPFEDQSKERVLALSSPGVGERGSDGRTASRFLREHASSLSGQGASDRAAHLRRVLALLDGSLDQKSTVVLIPFSSQMTRQASSGDLVGGALIIVLPGHHDLLYGQRELLIELGDLVAKSLADMRALDVAAIAETHAKLLEHAAEKLSTAGSDDDVFGLLLRLLGSSNNTNVDELPNRWGLCEHAVVWLLSPGYRELVVRSGRGEGLAALGERTVIDPRDHPFLRQEVKPDQVPRRELRLQSGFRLRMLRLDGAPPDPLLERYASIAGCKWLISFPLMHTNRKAIGVVDCVVSQPLRAEEQGPTEQAMRRLAAQVCSALDHTQFERLLAFSRVLSDKANEHLLASHAQEAYRAVVERVCDELGAAVCDLFHDQDGAMVLRSSTRWPHALGDNRRCAYWLRPAQGSEVLGAALVSRGIRGAHAMTSPEDLGHMSPDLRTVMGEDFRYERMAIPLPIGGAPPRPPQGLLYIRGPLSTQNADGAVKKSGLLTAEHRQHARDIAVVVHRVALMSRLVERQSWLVDELQHSLGQPLQGLSSWVAKAQDALVAAGSPDAKVAELTRGLNNGFAFVHEARGRLAVYAKMSQVIDPSELHEVHLDKVIRDYASFFQPMADNKNCELVLHLKTVRPVLAHESLLRAAVSNLFDNAIKYSYEKRIGHIDVYLDESAAGEIRMVFENYGVGIPSDDLERIFEPYYRSRVPDAGGERRGSGIGLAIVKHAIEKVHGGQIKAESAPPKDADLTLPPAEVAKRPHKTTFTVTLVREHLARMAGHAQ